MKTQWIYGAGWLAILMLAMANVSMADLSDGLVARWSFDSYADPGHDDSGNGYDATVNGATPAQGIWGNALSFDGVDDEVVTPLFSGGSTPDAFTATCWFKSDESNGYLFGKYDDSTDTGWGVVLGSAVADRFQIIVGVGDGDRTSLGTFVNDGAWHHLALTRDGDLWDMYFDAVHDASLDLEMLAVDMLDSDLALTFMQRADYFTAGFTSGYLDEVRIYDRVLSSAEIERLSVVPAPGAFLLGTIGFLYSGWRLRRRKAH